MNATTKSSVIDKLPNEILRSIISFIPKRFKFVYFEDEDRKGHIIHQILILLQVSRRLRIVVQESSFWHDEDFEFSELCFVGVQSFRSHFVGALTRALLADKYFQSCLRLKTHWTFSNLGEILGFLESGVGLYSSVETISFYGIPKIDVAIKRLDLLPHITFLSIVFDGSKFEREINLDLISANCPLLKVLELFGLWNYRGSLKNLTSLRQLEIAVEHSYCFRDDLFPIHSTSTLNEIILSGLKAGEYFNPNPTVINCFSNLTHLVLRPIVREFAMIIAHSSAITLTSLSIDLPWDESSSHITELVKIVLNADAVRLLKKLELRHVTWKVNGTGMRRERIREPKYTAQDYSEIIECITSRLPSLHYLKLILGLDISWGPLFTQLKNLKSFEWAVPTHIFSWPVEGQFVRYTDLRKSEIGSPSWRIEKLLQDPEAVLEEWFKAFFSTSGFIEMPEIRISLIDVIPSST